VRILVVTPTVPWPAHSGLQIRIASTVRSLAVWGDVDLFSLSPDGPVGVQPVPAHEPVGVWHGGDVRLRPRGLPTRARLMLGRRPRVVAARDYERARAELADIVARYDLVWWCRAETLVAVAPPLDVPAVVDLDDLEAVKIRAACRLRDHGRSASGGAHRAIDALAMRWDAHRWDRVQLDAMRRARVAVVASEADQQRLGMGDIAVVPNTYPVPQVQAGKPAVAAPPVISFVGLLTYPPNADAVRHLAREIVPRVRAVDPSVRFRAVGRHDGILPRECPSVSFAGEVDDIEPELGGTDAVAVPVRVGSGTRVKILEAFAHGVPVVSTRVGAEGLAVRDGAHLLLADDPDAFAAACVRVLRDVALRRRLAAAGRRLWDEQHGPAAFQRSVDEVIGRARPTGSGPISSAGRSRTGTT
jgi:glycosyltransferase involved in cell wall biosynthesis